MTGTRGKEGAFDTGSGRTVLCKVGGKADAEADAEAEADADAEADGETYSGTAETNVAYG